MGTELAILPLEIHEGDVIAPWNVEVDGSSALNRIVADLRRRVGNPPAQIQGAMETVGRALSPAIEMRGLGDMRPECILGVNSYH